jgi:hypothetical protein
MTIVTGLRMKFAVSVAGPNISTFAGLPPPLYE